MQENLEDYDIFESSSNDSPSVINISDITITENIEHLIHNEDLGDSEDEMDKANCITLTSDNYHTWKVLIRALLVRKKLWIELDTPLDNSPETKQKLEEAFSIIIPHCDATHIELLDTVASQNSVEALKALQDKYEGKGLMAKLMILNKTRMLSLEGKTVETYIEQLKSNYQKLSAQGLIVPEIFKVSDLMIKMPSNLSNVMANLFNIDEKDLKFDNVAATLIAESQRQAMVESTSTALVTTKTTKLSKRQRLTCTFCKKKGHSEEKCFLKHPSKKPQTQKVRYVINEDHEAELSSSSFVASKSAFCVRALMTSKPKIFKRLGPSPSPKRKSPKQTYKYIPFLKPSTPKDEKVSTPLRVRKLKALEERSIRHKETTTKPQPTFALPRHRSIIPKKRPSEPDEYLTKRKPTAPMKPPTSKFTQQIQPIPDQLNNLIHDKQCEEWINKELELYPTAFSLNTKRNISGWIVDSGASLHMSFELENFTHLKQVNGGKIKLADGSFIPIAGIGRSKILLNSNDGPIALLLKNVAYVPLLDVNLVSVNELTKSGYDILFQDDCCKIKIKNKFINFAKSLNNNYVIDENSNKTAFPCIHEWHRRMAHRNTADIKYLKTFGMKITKCGCPDQCDACMKGKTTEVPYKPSVKPENRLEVIVSDLCGPIQTKSLGGAKYFITFTDVATDYTEVKFLHKKSDATQHVIDFIEHIKTQLNKKPKVFRSDGGGEYVNQELNNYLTKEGIRIERTTSNSPQSNGIAERKNRTLNDAVRTMLIAAKLPEQFWAEAMNNAVYTQNRLIRQGKTASPFELFFGRKQEPHFLEFGMEVYVPTSKPNRKKLTPHATIMRYLGVDDKTKGFRIWNGSKLIINRSVKPKLTVEFKYEESIKQQNPVVHTNDAKENSPVLRRSKRLQKISTNHVANATDAPSEPKTYKQAINSQDKDKWIEAMQEEINSLIETGTYELSDLPKERKAIGCKWVFKRKEEVNGVRYKARLVAKGFLQKYGEDYDEVFAPVARPASMQLLLSMAGKLKLEVQQFDVKTAFLNGTLEEEIYMKQPEGFESGSQVLRLRKSLYGLKQAARTWNTTLKNCLEKIGFKQSEADACFFYQIEENNVCYMVIHVDDLLVASSNSEITRRIVAQLSKSFEIKSLGPVKHYLGIDIHKTKDGYYGINQEKYITNVATELGLQNAKGQKYPIQPGYYKLESEFLPSNTEYRRIIGKLLYISNNTRPDISASVSILAQRVEKPRELDLQEAKRVVKYLNNTKDHVLLLNNKNVNQSLLAFSDANFGECRIDRKSNSGLICFVNGGPIIWSSRKQTIVALSTCEAEYYAITETAKEIIWLQELLEIFKIKNNSPSPILADNQSSIAKVYAGNDQQRTKYIGIKYHFINDALQQGIISLKYCPTEYNIADMLTKPLCGIKLQKLRTAAGLLPKGCDPPKEGTNFSFSI